MRRHCLQALSVAVRSALSYRVVLHSHFRGSSGNLAMFARDAPRLIVG